MCLTEGVAVAVMAALGRSECHKPTVKSDLVTLIDVILNPIYTGDSPLMDHRRIYGVWTRHGYSRDGDIMGI